MLCIYFLIPIDMYWSVPIVALSIGVGSSGMAIRIRRER